MVPLKNSVSDPDQVRILRLQELAAKLHKRFKISHLREFERTFRKLLNAQDLLPIEARFLERVARWVQPKQFEFLEPNALDDPELVLMVLDLLHYDIAKWLGHVRKLRIEPLAQLKDWCTAIISVSPT